MNQVGKMWTDLRRNKAIYVMLIPVILYFIVFKYGPLYGATIAFKDYTLVKGINGSPWVGFEHFVTFFESPFFFRVLRNTLLLSLYSLLFAFPAPILLALALNEVRNALFKRFVQTVTYIPHFISLVVVCGFIIDFLARDGVITDLIVWLGGERNAYLSQAEHFRTIYIASGIWQEIGWGSIIYLAALSGINPELYEAAKVDGAGRLRQVRSITLPGILPTIMILFIMKIGSLLDVGYEKIILLYSPTTYETADVISSFVYRKGILEGSAYSYTTAVGLFQSALNFMLLIVANSLSRRFTGNKLW